MADTKDEKDSSLPVLSSWGAMLPNVPPSGYGDIIYEPSDEEVDAPAEEGLSPLDRDALALRRKVFPSSRR